MAACCGIFGPLYVFQVVFYMINTIESKEVCLVLSTFLYMESVKNYVIH
jgi:hypothetical protein